MGTKLLFNSNPASHRNDSYLGIQNLNINPQHASIGSSQDVVLNFYHGYFSSLSITILSELGDKTFFIAAIMAMRNSRMIVFAGAITALILMTVLSTAMGMVATNIPRQYVVYISSLLFFVCGIKMLRDGYKMSPNDSQEEYQEIQEDILKREYQMSKTLDGGGGATDLEEGLGNCKEDRHTSKSYFRDDRLHRLIYTVGLQAFTLTFLAEWGDRSQIATIVLAAKENMLGVTLGAIMGHSACTLLAVYAGRYISTKLSVRLVTLAGGIVFILFAISTLIMDSDYFTKISSVH